MNESGEKIVILGGKGMLGSDLASECTNRGYDIAILDLPEFDITDEEQVKKTLSDTKIVINCAAYTNVEQAESESELAYKVNADAVGKLGEIAKANGIWVLHISTDFVFDGSSDRPYVETDEPNPINVYGKSKLAGEKLLIESECMHCIIRVEWTYGLAGNNFIVKLISIAKDGKPLKVIDDQIGSPTATTRVSKAICELLKRKEEGLFHFASSGYVSRYDMARFVFDELNMDVDLSSCKTSDYVTAAARPLNSCFNCGKIEALLGEPIRPWQEPLEEFLGQL